MGLFDIFRRKKKVKSNKAEEKTPTKSVECIETAPIEAETTTPATPKSDPKKDSSGSKKSSASHERTEEKASAPTTVKADKVVEEEPLPEIEESDGDVVTESKPTRTGKFEIKRAKDGRYHFNLYASNHILIARSQVYSSSSKAMQGINSVIANAPKAKIEDQTLKNPVTVSFPKWEIYIDNAGKYRFRLCATNGSCICHSRGYTTKANCKNGIESITRFANDAEIKKVYLDKK